MSLSRSYEISYQAWQKFYARVVEQPEWLAWKEHIKYFQDIAACVIDSDFDLDKLWKSMYRQPQAGFYRWNILDGVSNNTVFDAKFHVFPDRSRTYIHAHGYEWFSHVLDGSLKVVNFLPQRVSKELDELLKIFSSNAFYHVWDITWSWISWMLPEWMNLQDYVDASHSQIWQADELNVLNRKYGIANIKAFKKMQRMIQDDPQLISQIHEELYYILIWEQSDYSEVIWFLVHVVLWFESVQEFSKNMLHWDLGYQMEHQEPKLVFSSDTHNVWINEAHSVEVLDPGTSTLFLTRKNRVRMITDASEWEYKLFSKNRKNTERYGQDIDKSRKIIIDKLKQIFPEH